MPLLSMMTREFCDASTKQFERSQFERRKRGCQIELAGTKICSGSAHPVVVLVYQLHATSVHLIAIVAFTTIEPSDSSDTNLFTPIRISN